MHNSKCYLRLYKKAIKKGLWQSSSRNKFSAKQCFEVLSGLRVITWMLKNSIKAGKQPLNLKNEKTLNILGTLTIFNSSFFIMMWSFWRKKNFSPFSNNTKSISTEANWFKHTFFSISFFFFSKQEKLDHSSNTIKYMMKNEVALEFWGHVLAYSSFRTKMVCPHYWDIQSQRWEKAAFYVEAE